MRDPIIKNVVWVVVIGGVILPAAWFLWQPHSDYLIAYLPKFVFILVVGALGGLQLAKVIGWCVGWLLDPTTSHAGSEISGDERVFHVSRWRETVITLGCLGLVGFFVWSFDNLNPVMGAIGVPTFAPWVFVFGMQAMFPARLALGAAGFEVKHWSGPLERVAWADVEPLYVWGVNPALVSYRYRKGRSPARLGWAGRWYRHMNVGDGTIPTGLPIDSEALCQLMNQMREHALVGEPSSPGRSWQGHVGQTRFIVGAKQAQANKQSGATAPLFPHQNLHLRDRRQRPEHAVYGIWLRGAAVRRVPVAAGG